MFCASFRSASRWRIDACETLIGGFRLPNLLADLAVFDARDDLAVPDRVAELDVDDLQPPVGARHHFDSGRPDQVADDENLLGHRRRAWTVANSTGIGGRARPAAASSRHAPLGRAAAAFVDHHPGQRDEGDDHDCDCPAHRLSETSF